MRRNLKGNDNDIDTIIARCYNTMIRVNGGGDGDVDNVRDDGRNGGDNGDDKYQRICMISSDNKEERIGGGRRRKKRMIIIRNP